MSVLSNTFIKRSPVLLLAFDMDRFHWLEMKYWVTTSHMYPKHAEIAYQHNTLTVIYLLVYYLDIKWIVDQKFYRFGTMMNDNRINIFEWTVPLRLSASHFKKWPP